MLRLLYCSHCGRPHYVEYLYRTCFDCCSKLYANDLTEVRKMHPRYPFRHSAMLSASPPFLKEEQKPLSELSGGAERGG